MMLYADINKAACTQLDAESASKTAYVVPSILIGLSPIECLNLFDLGERLIFMKKNDISQNRTFIFRCVV